MVFTNAKKGVVICMKLTDECARDKLHKGMIDGEKSAQMLVDFYRITMEKHVSKYS